MLDIFWPIMSRLTWCMSTHYYYYLYACRREFTKPRGRINTRHFKHVNKKSKNNSLTRSSGLNRSQTQVHAGEGPVQNPQTKQPITWRSLPIYSSWITLKKGTSWRELRQRRCQGLWAQLRMFNHHYKGKPKQATELVDLTLAKNPNITRIGRYFIVYSVL